MRKTTATLLAAIAAFILIFCIAFTAVSLTANNFSFFENEFKKLKLADSMGLSLSDMSLSIQAMVGYMNGSRPSIDVDVMLKGERVPMFALEIEHTHMVEVRTLWQRLTGLRGIFLLLSALLAIGAMTLEKKEYKRVICTGYLWGFGIFLLLFGFGGTWAGLNFNSFWTFFHGLIFPGSDTWLLPAESRMIQMLPEALFADVAGRCAWMMLLPSFILAGLAVLGLFLLARQEMKAAGVENVITAEAEEVDEVLAVGEPDLIFVHKKANMPVSRRKQLVEEMEQRNAMEAEAERLRTEEEETLGEDPSLSASDDALKVKFEPFSPSKEEYSDDD